MSGMARKASARFMLLCLLGVSMLSMALAANVTAPALTFGNLSANSLTVTNTATVSIGTGDTAIFYFITPAQTTRNRFMYYFNVTLNNTNTNAISYLTVLHSCPVPSCDYPVPSLAFTSPYLYDMYAAQAFASKAFTAYNPRIASSYYPFTQSKDTQYPGCRCLNQQPAVQPATQNEQWYMRTGVATAPLTVSAFGGVADICSGHGYELGMKRPDGSTETDGCLCDAGYFGHSCGQDLTYSGGPILPCCNNEFTSISATPNQPIKVTNASVVANPLRGIRATDRVFTFTSNLNTTLGVDYRFRIRNLASNNSLCTPTSSNGWAMQYFVTAVCNPTTNLNTCFDNQVFVTYSSPNTYSDYYQPSVNFLSAWTSGQWVDFTFSASQTRNKCGCSQYDTYNRESLVIVKIALAHPSCDFEIQGNSTAYCQNGGTYINQKGCKCLPGFGGANCENTCSTNVGGPECNAPFYALSDGVPQTFTSTLSNQTFFTFTTAAPLNLNPRMLRITISGVRGENAVARIAGKESCDDYSSCPIRSVRSTLNWNQYGQDPRTPWPNDFGLNDFNYGTPRAWATFVSEGPVSQSDLPFVTGLPVGYVTPRTNCGCSSRNISDPSYRETWNFAFTHKLSSTPTATFTITIDSLDVCSGQGYYNSVTKNCNCNPAYPRGGDSCKSTDSYLFPCCSACSVGSSSLNALNCSTDSYAEVNSTSVSAVAMPITRQTGEQIPGILPTTTAMVYNGEKAIFRIPSFPQNPKGNPWLARFSLSAVLLPPNLLFFSGTHTCSKSQQCTALLPFVKTNPTSQESGSWNFATPSQNIIRQPMDAASIGTLTTPDIYTSSFRYTGNSNISIAWAPSSYYLRSDSTYNQVLVGNISTTPQSCLCDINFYNAAFVSGADESVLVPSSESWNFVTNQYQVFNTGGQNRMIFRANFSDICAGHGRWNQKKMNCDCDVDSSSNVPAYFGWGCGTSINMFPSSMLTYPYYKINAPVPQCCTAKMARAANPLLVPSKTYVMPSNAIAYVPIKQRDVFWQQYPDDKAIGAVYTGMTVYDIDQTQPFQGVLYSFTTQFVQTTSSDGSNPYTCNNLNYRMQGYMVCGNTTVSSCMDEIAAAPAGEGSTSISGTISTWAMGPYQKRSFCGCQYNNTRETAIVFLFTYTSAPNNGCDLSVSPTATVLLSCVPGQGVWTTIAGVGSCVCNDGWIGTDCSKSFVPITSVFQSAGYSLDGYDIKASETDMVNGDVWTSRLDMGSSSTALKLNLSISCSTRGTIGTNRVTLEWLRCFDEAPKRLPSYNCSTCDPSEHWYSPDETWTYVTDYRRQPATSTLDVLGTYIPKNDNPLQHCDRWTTTVQETSAAWLYGSFTTYTNTPGQLVVNTGPMMRPINNSPCASYTSGSGNSVAKYDDPSCTSSTPYYIFRVSTAVPSYASCHVKMTQTAGDPCKSSFISCSEHSGSCILPTNTSTAQCGACALGYEGVGCNMPTSSYLEVNNQETKITQSFYTERMRLRIQVSPSNDQIKFKLTFSQTTPCKSAACAGHVGKVWIRARLGSFPPSLITRHVVDENQKTVYLDSDGTDEELDPNNSTVPITQQSYDDGDRSVGTTLRRLLSSTTDEEVLTGQVFRYDLLTTDPDKPSQEVVFTDGTFKITANSFLYVDVYQGNMIDFSADASAPPTTGSTSSTNQFAAGNPNYATNLVTQIEITDHVGTLVGQIAFITLGAFALLVLVYVCYLRCRYGSVTGGVEKSVLTKAKVKRASIVPKTEKEIAREKRKREKERQRRMEKVQQGKQLNAEGEEPEGCCSKGVKIFCILIAFAFLLTFELLKVLFNISILHTSVGSYLPVVNFDAVAQSVSDGLNKLGLERLKDVWARFNDFFDFLGIFNQVSLKWNCGGALSMFAPVVILIGSIVLIIVLQKDYFLRFALSMKGSSEGTSKVVRKLRAAIATIFSTLLLYTLQSCILVLTQVVASTWNIKRSCSAFDAQLVYIGRYLCIIFIVILFYVAGLMFAGIKTINAHSLTYGWVTGVWALLQLTAGLWTQNTVARFDIHARARDFDIDDNHDENPEEAVMELQAASRGLMWTAFPIGIVLTKVTEQINAPPFLIVGDYIGVDITTPRWNRGLKWIVGMAKMLAVFYTVWSANQLVVMLTFILTGASVLLGIILPSDYHHQKWLKSRPVVPEDLATSPTSPDPKSPSIEMASINVETK